MRLHSSRLRTAVVSIALLALLGAAGCRQDMHDQPKYIPLRASNFYEDGRSARLQVANTVARGQLREDAHFYTGKVGGKPSAELPASIRFDRAFLERGRQRYQVFCTPCHSAVGDGNGMVVQRGMKRPPSYHEQRLKQIEIGHFYDVMTNGYGVMLNYASQIPPEDRWAIAAYIRVLQFSQQASRSDVPAGATVHPPTFDVMPMATTSSTEPHAAPSSSHAPVQGSGQEKGAPQGMGGPATRSPSAGAPAPASPPQPAKKTGASPANKKTGEQR